MAYMAVLSATLAIRKRAHIRMTTFDSYLPRKVIICLDLMADVAVLALGVMLVIHGITFCNSPLAAEGQYASLPGLQVVAVSALPVAGGSMIIFELEQIFLHIEAFFTSGTRRKEVA